MVEDILEIEDLKVQFSSEEGCVRAVDGISLSIKAKEIVGLVGESGCGKSMTAFSVMGLVPFPGKIVRGRIIFKGRDLLPLSKEELRKIRGSEISMIFQDPMTYLNPVMRVGEQIGEAIAVHRGGIKLQIEEKVISLLENVRLPSPKRIAKYYPHQLSGGMRQRILIAVALSCDPALIIADEPTTALDVTTQAQILRLIKSMVRDLGVSMILITHDLGIVADICDRLYVMYAGKIVEEAEVFSLYKDPKHPYTMGLIKSVLRIDKYSETLPTIEGAVPDLSNPPEGCRFHPRCPYAMDVCKLKSPALAKADEHSVACYLYTKEERS